MELVGPAAGQALVNQAIKYRHLKQFLVTLRVTLLPTLLMPETKKNPRSWLMLLRKASKTCSILAASLTAAVPPPRQQQQQQGPPAGPSIIQSSPLPRPGAVWLPAPGPQALPVPMKCSETVFPGRVSPHSLTLCRVRGTDLSRISFTVQCRDVPSKTQRVNTV